MGQHGMLGHGVPGIAEDGVADGEARHARPDGVDKARGFDADACGKGQVFEGAVLAFAALPVGRIDPGGADGDAHLVAAGLGHRDVDQAQDVGTAIGGVLDGFHEWLLSAFLY